MAETDDRVQDALATYLDYLEMGGPRPDTSHLTATEQQQLAELIDALESTEGVALGLGLEEGRPRTAAVSATTEQSEALHSELRDALPPDVRIEPDKSAFVTELGGVGITDRWIVGTFGGRVRVWLLEVDSAQELDVNQDRLQDLSRIFGAFPGTVAVALVAHDLSCLFVRPEDTAPQIQTPSGSLVGRRYEQPIRPVGEAVSTFLNELLPYWDPIPAFDRDAGLTIDASTMSKDFAVAAIEEQRSVGQRARKGNPKKDVLLGLGQKEISALTKLTDGLLDGSIDPDELAQRIEKLARGR